MSKINCINGWTKKRVLAHIKKYIHGVAMHDRGQACAYENKKGNRCAIGAFLDHKIHKQEIFDSLNNILQLIARYEFAHTLPFPIHILIDLQTIHDSFIKDAFYIPKKYSSRDFKTPEAALTAWVKENVEDDSTEGSFGVTERNEQ